MTTFSFSQAIIFSYSSTMDKLIPDWLKHIFNVFVPDIIGNSDGQDFFVVIMSSTNYFILGAAFSCVAIVGLVLNHSLLSYFNEHQDYFTAKYPKTIVKLLYYITSRRIEIALQLNILAIYIYVYVLYLMVFCLTVTIMDAETMKNIQSLIDR